MKRTASSASAFFERGKEKHLIHSSSVKNKQKNYTSCLRTLGINNLKSEGPVKSPQEKTDQRWKAVAGDAQLAPAASAAQPS